MFEKLPRRSLLAGCAIVGAAAMSASAPLSAHHSTAMFEWGKEIEMKNLEVEKWDWTNPHTFLYVWATDKDGNRKRWAFEGMSPNHLVRYGWSKNSVKPGDKVDITYYKLRDPRPGGFNVTITKSDGSKLFQFGERGTTQ